MFTYLLLLLPVSGLLVALHAPPIWIFITSAAAIVPLAEWIRRATEQVSRLTGSVLGSLLNVTFGNAAELLIAIFVLRTGNIAVVKATITGSIIGNSLLGLGMAIVFGSVGRHQQKFGRQPAGLLSSLLILSVIALLIPALFDYTERGLAISNTPNLDESLSLGVSIVLILVYTGNLIYTMITHRDIFTLEEPVEAADWSLARSMVVLIGGTALVAMEASFVADALESTARSFALSPFFIGIIVLPFIGNAAEYFTAIYYARKDHMGMVMSIAVGSSIQVALLTAPLLVLISWAMGHPMNLVFNSPLELIAIAAVAFAVNSIAQDGETTWFEGMLLLGVYALLGLAFFFVSP